MTARIGGNLAVLDAILEPSVNLASWQRSIPADIGNALLEWSTRAPVAEPLVLCAADYRLEPALEGIPGVLRAWVQTDIAAILDRFLRHAGASRFRLFFGPVQTDRCRKFHVDYVRMRLITTYIGPGTEWLPNDAVMREAMDHPVDCPREANRQILRDPSLVRRAQPGDVLLMKGATYGGVLGAVHRSPPIEELGCTRIVLVASTIDRSE